jgi:hypothetical protein
MTKPDFIIIGAMKSATSTLHTQLAMQSGIFMSTPKEPNYFSDDEQYAKGEQWYDTLFEQAEIGDLCGESSTHYTKLPDYPLTLERMSKRLSTIKLVYVMRHPIERLVSQYIHQWSQNEFKCDINEAIDNYQELTAYSCYARQLQPYIDHYGRENVLVVFTANIKHDPQAQLTRVAKFIGYEGQVKWQDDISAQNVSRERIRAFVGYQWIVESKLMTFLRRNLVPKSIRNRIKNKLTMQHRPVIDEPHLQLITELFDSDLAKLAEWYGIEINCDNYHDVVRNNNFSFQGLNNG